MYTKSLPPVWLIAYLWFALSQKTRLIARFESRTAYGVTEFAPFTWNNCSPLAPATARILPDGAIVKSFRFRTVTCFVTIFVKMRGNGRSGFT